MITLDTILRNLTYGEISQLSLGNFLPDEHESEPDPKSYAQLSSHINSGLHAIYSEFLLASEELYITLDDSISVYILSSQYAVSNTGSGEPIKYITDTVENPFTDNLLKIEEIYDTSGNVLPLNDENSDPDFGIFTPTFRSIQVPQPNDFEQLAVQYRATHTPIKYIAGMDPTTVEIVLPLHLEEALQFYIASRLYASLNNDQGSEGHDYYSKYQAKVADVRRLGLYIQAEATNWRFTDNGWV